MSKNVQEKILKYETFLNERLKPDLNAVLQDRDNIYSEIAELLALKSSINAIEEAGLTKDQPLKSKVDLGCNFYVQAQVPNPDRIFVDIGLGFFVELTLPQARKFIDEKVELLESKAKVLTEDSCKVKANIKLTLHGLRELQRLTHEDLLAKKRRDPINL